LGAGETRVLNLCCTFLFFLLWHTLLIMVY